MVIDSQGVSSFCETGDLFVAASETPALLAVSHHWAIASVIVPFFTM
jgi:hypothetical protein